MSKYFILLIILFPLISLSQVKEVFIDENMNEVSKSIYLEKCRSRALYCLNYKSDSLIVNKVHNKYVFGKISDSKLNQIKQLLSDRSQNKINSNQTIVIKYNDTLGNTIDSYMNYLKIRAKDKREDLKSISQKKLKNRLERRNKYLAKKLKKCSSRYEKNDQVKVFTTYKYLGLDEDNIKPLNLVFYNDDIWFRFLNKIRNPRFVIIKPNGEYFLTSTSLDTKRLDLLLNETDWNIHKKDLELTKNEFPKNGKGIFRTLVIINQDFLFCF